MNHCSSNQAKHCCCGSSPGPQLWSKKKKLKVLKHQLECLDEKKQDIQDAIDELKTKD